MYELTRSFYRSARRIGNRAVGKLHERRNIDCRREEEALGVIDAEAA
jgi:hypothetical protein